MTTILSKIIKLNNSYYIFINSQKIKRYKRKCEAIINKRRQILKTQKSITPKTFLTLQPL